MCVTKKRSSSSPSFSAGRYPVPRNAAMRLCLNWYAAHQSSVRFCQTRLLTCLRILTSFIKSRNPCCHSPSVSEDEVHPSVGIPVLRHLQASVSLLPGALSVHLLQCTQIRRRFHNSPLNIDKMEVGLNRSVRGVLAIVFISLSLAGSRTISPYMSRSV